LLTIQSVFATHHDGINERVAMALFAAIGDCDDEPQMRPRWIGLAATF
jgi:hypothetical protein